MNLPKSILYTAVTILLFVQSLFSQKDSTKKIFYVSVDIGIIMNKPFSHYANLPTMTGHSGAYEEMSEAKNPNAYLPGYCFGLTSILFLSPACGFVFGTSLTSTQSKYNYKAQDGISKDVGNMYTIKNSNYDISSKFLYLNIDAGYRVKVFKKIFLQLCFSINKNILTTQKETGSEKTIQTYAYNAGPGAPPNYYHEEIKPIDITRCFSEKEIRGSAKFSAGYTFKIKGHNYCVSGFRNFGIGYKLPWWGLVAGLVF